MSENQKLKKHMLQMSDEDMQSLLTIIGDLGYIGYKVAICKIKGYSYQQCANKYSQTIDQARYVWEKSTDKGYDVVLKKLFDL